jgi:hypothetical protein
MDKQVKKDVVQLIDEVEDLSRIVITSSKDFLADDCLNFIHKDYVEDIDEDKEFKVIEDYLDIPHDDQVDELFVFGVLSLFELDEHEEHIKYWLSLIKEGGTIYIQDLCLDNIARLFFVPNEFTGEQVTSDNIKMGLLAIFGKDKYKRRSIIAPTLLGDILVKLGVHEVKIQQRGTMAMLKGTISPIARYL